jgi:hypothetical protein
LTHTHIETRLRTVVTTTTLAAGTLLVAAPALAQAGEPVRTWLTLQGAYADTRVTTRHDGFLGDAGTDISHEADLQLPRRNTAGSVHFGRRLGERWRIEVTGDVNRRQGSAVLTRPVVVGDQTFAQGSSVVSEARQTVVRVQGGYAFLKTPDSEWGLSFGGQLVGSRLDMGQAGTGTTVHSYDVPMAVLGIFGRQQLGQGDWWLDGRVTSSAADYTQAQAGLVWEANRHLMLGLGYQFTRTRVEDTQSGFIMSASAVQTMHLQYRAHGPQLSMQLGF